MAVYPGPRYGTAGGGPRGKAGVSGGRPASDGTGHNEKGELPKVVVVVDVQQDVVDVVVHRLWGLPSGKIKEPVGASRS